MIESITRKELRNLYDTYVMPTIKKLERSNANTAKIVDDFEALPNYRNRLIHVICILMLLNSLNKKLDEMLNYNIVFLSKPESGYKIIDRLGNVVATYQIDKDTNHLIYNSQDLGVISITACI